MHAKQLFPRCLVAFWGLGLLTGGGTAAEPVLRPDGPNDVKFEPAEARFVRFVIHAGTGSEPCLDELEVYGPEGKQNLALAAQGAKAGASSCLPGYPIHQIAHLNDGQYILVSHAPLHHFGLFVIDRYGNRELLYLDPAIGSMAPTPLRPVPRPPVLAEAPAAAADGELGEFVVSDVYRGLEPQVERGKVKYLRVCEELRSNLEQLPDGRYKEEYPPFQDYYAAPTHRLSGPHGWPSFVAKGVHGLVPVTADGSAHFFAPAGRVLYFQVLDENLNELQRMRSVVQLQPGERRSCIGCHEDRRSAPPPARALAARSEPSHLQPPAWGPGPFSYQRVVQPVWDARCVRCHNAADKQNLNLTGVLDVEQIPASYRTLIAQGWVHYFSYSWGLTHHKAAPLSFGTLQSKLRTVLDGRHYEVRLTPDERHRIKCWIDLNCPLWPDYLFRPDRPTLASDTR
jgi:hypothetical protein